MLSCLTFKREFVEVFVVVIMLKNDKDAVCLKHKNTNI